MRLQHLSAIAATLITLAALSGCGGTKTKTVTSTVTTTATVTEVATATVTATPIKVIATRTQQVRVTYTPPAVVAFTDGEFIVGTEVKPGIYHTDGQGDSGGCYWARLSSLTTSDIIDNNNISGPSTIQVQSSDKALETNGGCSWTKVG